ncbi:hypothetical protein Y032_0421g1176 [Ancylostoma ceylanicum]|uniref:Uncharacterized protein n=1 Tax=Ancylostoma ceylanicum TaxID=53326 RepID=A0A016X163_9BILA|nr:hypothetical protein Y032_0421g1176 [Ancylostoma ceylanicum]
MDKVNEETLDVSEIITNVAWRSIGIVSTSAITPIAAIATTASGRLMDIVNEETSDESGTETFAESEPHVI